MMNKANIQTTRPEKDLDLLLKIGNGTYGEVYKATVKATGALVGLFCRMYSCLRLSMPQRPRNL